MKSRPKTPQVSLRGETYAKVKAHCEREGISPGKFVDELCRAFLEGGNGSGQLFTDEERQKLKLR